MGKDPVGDEVGRPFDLDVIRDLLADIVDVGKRDEVDGTIKLMVQEVQKVRRVLLLLLTKRL